MDRLETAGRGEGGTVTDGAGLRWTDLRRPGAGRGGGLSLTERDCGRRGGVRGTERHGTELVSSTIKPLLL